jgi:hypothetical protein
MSVQNDHQVSHSQAEDAWTDNGSDFVLIAEGKPPPRIELAKERMLICRLYLGLMRTITDDYGAAFAAHSDSLAYRTIGIYVFLRTVMCSPVRASQIAHALAASAGMSRPMVMRSRETDRRNAPRCRKNRHFSPKTPPLGSDCKRPAPTGSVLPASRENRNHSPWFGVHLGIPD